MVKATRGEDEGKEEEANKSSVVVMIFTHQEARYNSSFSRPPFTYMLRIHFCILDLLVCIAFDHIMLPVKRRCVE